MTLQLISQRDPRWSGVKLGTSSVTIGSHGCTISCLSMAAGINPDEVNSRLIKVSGYANENLVIWSKINEAIPTLSNGIRSKVYDNEKVKEAISKNGFCLVEVDGSRIGASRHWCLYIGDGRMLDPWYGTQKATSYYPPVGYASIDRLVPITQTQCEKDLAEQRQQVSNLQNQVNGLIEDIKKLEGGLSEEKQTTSGLRGRITELETQNSTLSSDLGVKTSELKVAEESLKRTQAALETELKDQHDWADVAEKEQIAHGKTKAILEDLVFELEEIGKLSHNSDAIEVKVSKVIETMKAIEASKTVTKGLNDYQNIIRIKGKTLWLS